MLGPESSGLFANLRASFWSERFWLPAGLGWEELADGPQASHMLLPIPLALLLCFLRHAFELKVARPLGLKCGLPLSPSPQVPLVPSARALVQRVRSAVLPAPGPKAHRLDCNGNHANGLSNGAVRSRRPKAGGGKLKLDKFSESCYRCTVYLGLFGYGVWALWDEEWAWHTEGCWNGWPRQELQPKILAYYLFEAAFYWGLIFTQASDAKRKDAGMNLLHHFVTLGLLWWSWTLNFVRIGALVMVVHDAVDPLLELAKMFKYANRTMTSNVVFGIFIVVWSVSRLWVFPFHVLRSTIGEAPRIIGGFTSYYLFNTCLLLLQVLHLLWTALIFKAVHKAVVAKDFIDDCRSSSEDTSDEEGDDSAHPKAH